jgi:hypothetical protein
MHRLFRLAPVALVACLALLAALPAGARGPTFMLRDTVGDAEGTAPDIDTVNLWNEEDGTVTFQLTFANRSELTEDDLVLLLFDTDGNLDNNGDGAEYAIFVTRAAQVFLRWNGADWESTGSTLARPSALSVTLNRADLGNVDKFMVAELSTTDADDDAFDGTGYGPFVFFFEPKLTGATLTVAPAGGTLRVGTKVTARVAAKLDDGTTAKPTTVTCRMTLAGKAVKPVAPCVWKLPKAAKGKRVVITAKGTYRGKAFATKQVVIRVR